MLEFSENDELFVGDDLLKEFFSCSSCGVCCKFFSQLPVYNQEIIEVCSKSEIPLVDFKNKYLKKNKIKGATEYSLKTPCSFLQQNYCRIYKHRFLICRTFPLFMNLTTQKAILSGIYLCPQSTQFYEGLLEYYKKNNLQVHHQLIENEKHVKFGKEGMKITAKTDLFIPYIDLIMSKK